MVMSRTVRLQIMSNTDGVLLARARKPMRQMGVTTTCAEARGIKFPREAKVLLRPHLQTIINIDNGEEVLLWEPDQEEALVKFLNKPLLPTNMTILFWNVRGIGRPSFKPNLRLLVNQHHPKIVILAEARVSRETTNTILENVGFDSCHVVELRGFAGGIILHWNSNIMNFHYIGENSQGVHGVVEACSTNLSYVLSAIYASPSYADRKLLWQDLCNIAGVVKSPWIAIGDFNEIINQGEKFGGQPIKINRANLYASTMNACSLLDLGYQGQKYTWSNMRKKYPIFTRLDRGWVNPEWITKFSNSNLWNLPRVTLDHCPILVYQDNPPPKIGNKPFRFEPMWLLDHTFEEKIKTSWPREGREIGSMLLDLKEVLVEWNINTFGNVYIRKKGFGKVTWSSKSTSRQALLGLPA